MFEKLRLKSVIKVEQGVPFTFPLGLPAIIAGSQILEYLYQEETGDYSKSGYPEKLPPNEGFDPNQFREIQIRFLARATSYIITVCNLDGILKRSYKHFLKYLQNIGYSCLIPVEEDSKLCNERKREISDYLFYRNKVFAHISFAQPQNDSVSLQYTTLAYYSGTLFNVKDNYLTLGGGSIIVHGHIEEPPGISIVGRHPEVKDHYLKWESMFTDILDDIVDDELSKKLERTSLLS